MRWMLLPAVLAVVVIAGCEGGSEPADRDAARTAGQKQGVPNKVASDPAKQTVREPAKVGVGQQGSGIQPGPVGTPIKALFGVKERLVFDVQIAGAMKLYRATNGHYPKSQQEFDARIIKENSIQLPRLPPGAEYVYDPKRAAEMTDYDPDDPPLRVERPAN